MAETMMCSVHFKKRLVTNLMDDGNGGFRCVEGHICGENLPPKRPGDWNCPNCRDFCFARNSQCRKCGTPKPADWGGAPNNSGGTGSNMQETMMKMMTMMMGVMMSSKMGKGGAAKSGPGPDMMHMMSMMGQGGGMMGQGGGGGGAGGANVAAGTMRPGDWVCEACGDVQFAKNTHCRKCGTPKPGTELTNQGCGVDGGAGDSWSGDGCMAAMDGGCQGWSGDGGGDGGMQGMSNEQQQMMMQMMSMMGDGGCGDGGLGSWGAAPSGGNSLSAPY